MSSPFSCKNMTFFALAVAVFFLWVYYSAAILILGAEFAHLLEKTQARRRARGGSRSGRA